MEPTISEFTIMFGIATTGMLVLAIAIVFFVVYYQKKMLQAKLKQQELEGEYQQKMLLASLESQESERKRLAAELHDSIGAMLSTVRVSLATVMRNQEENARVGQVKHMIDETIESVRRISRDLMPSTLEMFGLAHALKDMSEQYSSMSDVNITCEEVGTPGPLDKSKQLIAFRIVQEFLNNSIKHANAKNISGVVTWDSELHISLHEDGNGFDMNEIGLTKPGIGLYTMQNRARMLNTELRFESVLKQGTSASLNIPLT
jgi:signal transduction histidine kinase